MEKIKEVIYNDLELYFYLYRDKEKWELTVRPTYVDRARTTLGFFVEVLEGFCVDNHYNIYDREYKNNGIMNFCIELKDRFIFKPKNGIYDTPLTTKRQ